MCAGLSSPGVCPQPRRVHAGRAVQFAGAQGRSLLPPEMLPSSLLLSPETEGLGSLCCSLIPADRDQPRYPRPALTRLLRAEPSGPAGGHAAQPALSWGRRQGWKLRRAGPARGAGDWSQPPSAGSV